MGDYPKLNGVEHEILRLLAQQREMYGLEMVKASPKVIKRGSVYVTLLRLEDKGWIRSQQEENPGHSGLPRRLYSIAAPGLYALRQAEAVQGALDLISQPVGA